MAPADEVLTTIALDMEPRWVAAAPDGSRVYVTLSEVQADGPTLGAVAVIETETCDVLAKLSLGDPSGVAVSPDGRRAYVPNRDPRDGRGVVSVIDTATNAIAGSVAVSAPSGSPKGVAVTPDGRNVYVATEHEELDGQGMVSVIDAETEDVVATIGVNPFPAAVAIRPDGRFAYVLDLDGDPAVIDTVSLERTFPFGGQLSAARIAFSPDGAHAYAIRDADTQVFVIDGATAETVQMLEASGLTTDLAVGPDRRVYVTQRTRHQLSVFETGTPAAPSHPVGWSGTADGIALMPDGRTAWVSDRASRAVRVVPVGPRPGGRL
jgi:YVTN family beta-propeller protein